jgi:hypothetical protein
MFGGFRDFSWVENVAKSMIFWWGGIFLSLADIFSILGAWVLKSKC